MGKWKWISGISRRTIFLEVDLEKGNGVYTWIVRENGDVGEMKIKFRM